MNATRRAYKRSSAADVLAVSELLKDALHNANGLCYYKEGYNDQVVAEKARAAGRTAIQTAHVSTIRRNLYGEFRRPVKEAKVRKPKVDKADTPDENRHWLPRNWLERLSALERANTLLEGRVRFLEQSLGVDKMELPREVTNGT